MMNFTQRIAFVGGIVAALFSSMPMYAAQLDNALIKQGEYIAQIGGCESCHTVNEAKSLAGGLALRTPFGAIYSTNITPDNTTGIGQWSFEQFWQAMHHGKGVEGKLLYPVFPYTSYTKLSKQDAQALYAYLQTKPAIQQKNREAEFDFPYNMRHALIIWRALYFTEGEFQADKNQSDAWNRGAYLVQGLGHCNECHTTRNALGAVQQDSWLIGGLIPEQDWYAPNLGMQKNGGLEGWTEQDIVMSLTTGMSSKGSVLGPMAEVVHNSTQYLTEADAKAIASYLATVPAPTAQQQVFTRASDYDDGKAIFTAHCETCHGKNGEGVEGQYPALANNPTVMGASPVNAIRVVLLGGFAVSTQTNPMPYSMPAFAAQLNNNEIAAVVNYIRQSWQHNASAVTADKVKAVRFKPAH